ncbi:MAG TPA: hypothetical protein VES40_21745 [Ilumatobacteraceae bacterium]|nr:hypothetical protein [Ilumatobacteraceae bacterium]
MTDLVAIVVVHPARGVLSPRAAITADTIGEFLPDVGEFERVMDWFDAAGFVVDSPGPISFSIEGDRERFESWFGDIDNGPFDLDALPDDIRQCLAAVEFMDAPDFGPGNP